MTAKLYSLTEQRLKKFLVHNQYNMPIEEFVEWANRQVYTGLTEMYYLQGQEESKDATTEVS